MGMERVEIFSRFVSVAHENYYTGTDDNNKLHRGSVLQEDAVLGKFYCYDLLYRSRDIVFCL